MTQKATTPDEYVEQLPEDRREAIEKLRNILRENLPEGFNETMSYGMISYVVPHSTYPDGYHCDPEKPLPFIQLASQKNHMALYHMGLYVRQDLLDWFVADYPKYVKRKLDMGKSCIRFKKMEHIPYDLIAELAQKMTVEDWIAEYEGKVKR